MWNFLRRTFVILVVVLAALVVFRGPLYRMVIRYEVIGTRNTLDVTVPLPSTATTELDIHELINAALDTTADRLHFSTGRVSNDVSVLANGGPANCIGYAALFKALLLERLTSTSEPDAYSVEQVIGQLHIGSWNIHSAFNSPFWKDHDIVRITQRRTASIIYVDPTLYDVMGIGVVSGP